MINFINKIKQFFRNIISRNRIKKLYVPEESNLSNSASSINNNKIDKNEFFEIYNKVKNETIDLENIKREDLLKIRKLLLEESKIQDERFENEIKFLESFKKVS